MMKIALESMKQLSLSSPSHSNMKGGTPAKSNVMEKSLNQSLLNWNVVSNYFYTLLARIYIYSVRDFQHCPRTTNWIFFLVLIAGESQDEDIDDEKSMSAQTTDLGMNYILYGAIHILYCITTCVHFLQLQCGNYVVWKCAVKPL